MFRIVGGLLVVTFALALVEGAQPGEKSPEDVFQEAAAAIKKEDVKGFFAHLTKDSQSAVSGGMVMVLGMAKAFAKFDKKDGAEKAKLIDDLFTRHGLSDDVLAKLKGADKSDDKSIGRVILALGGLVKDKAAFTQDALKVLPKLSKKDQPFKEIGEASLKDVKMDGDKAQGQLTSRKDGTEKTETLYFRMEDGAWKIDVLRMMEEKSKAKK
jgi:hypothetical protein